MIEGITILNQKAIMTLDFNWAVFIILALCAVGIGIFAGCKSGDAGLGAFSCFILLVVSMFIALCCSQEITTKRNEYEVLIDESVNFKDVTDNYKYIKRRGEIYILQDKEK